MPELPEVETVKRTLQGLVKGKMIQNVQVHLPRIIRHPEVEEFQRVLEGKVIEDIERRGKFLLFRISEGMTLISHLRMEGNYGLFEEGEPVAKHTHVIFTFSDGTELRYRDVRQFGTMDLIKSEDVLSHSSLSKLGYEPFDEGFTAAIFYQGIKTRRKSIKTTLLDQAIVTGVGNIYADEILFRSKVSPQTIAGDLSKKQANIIYENIKIVLTEAIDAGGSSVKSYVNGQGEMGMFQQQLYVYQKHGEPCQVCGEEIQKIRHGGRGTHFCPKCQRTSKR